MCILLGFLKISVIVNEVCAEDAHIFLDFFKTVGGYMSFI